MAAATSKLRENGQDVEPSDAEQVREAFAFVVGIVKRGVNVEAYEQQVMPRLQLLAKTLGIE